VNAKVTGITHDGGFAQYVVVPAESVARLPADLDPAEAGPLMCAGVTTYNALRNSGARAGDTVAVQGIGGLGHLAIQYAAKMGFRTIALSSGSDKEELARQLGAHEYIDTNAVKADEGLQRYGGADVVLATAPHASAIASTVSGLKARGKLVVVAAPGQDLPPLLDRIGDPYVQAVSYLINAWTSSVVNDFDRAVREASVSLAKLRDQDEPLWTAMALLSVGSLEIAVSRFDDAALHLIETRDLAERFDNDWLAGASRVRLGLLALARGRLDDAQALFDDALDRSLATDNTYNVILCLVAFAQLTLAEGDPDRAALLAGAASSLRRRAGLQVFTSLTGEVQMVAQIRQALEADRFDQAFGAGSRLGQQEAVAAVRDHRGAAGRESPPTGTQPDHRHHTEPDEDPGDPHPSQQRG